MTVEINRKPKEVGDLHPATLAALLEREGMGRPGQAVAVDNRVVGRPDWASTPLADGMKITVITAVCGG
ncbi:MAG: sulfur carrier protein ThiS [Pseudoflavonifractor sp.]|nr:sulfur carrier protein ThiS [Alloprevotella sp.]MCM1117092.1 sulfur carrier protein ThiS [Pseudoflavonifractor sp.]